jgi:hypothetical protein
LPQASRLSIAHTPFERGQYVLGNLVGENDVRGGGDPFLRSTAMFKGANDDNRIVRQKCGILFGSSWACRNSAQRYIALKLELDFDLPADIDPRIVYPTMDEDPISREILERFTLGCEMIDERDGSAPSEVRFPPSFVESW